MMSLFSPLKLCQVFSPLLNQILNAHTASESQNIANTLAKQISDMFLGKFEAIFDPKSLHYSKAFESPKVRDNMKMSYVFICDILPICSMHSEIIIRRRFQEKCSCLKYLHIGLSWFAHKCPSNLMTQWG